MVWMSAFIAGEIGRARETALIGPETGHLRRTWELCAETSSKY